MDVNAEPDQLGEATQEEILSQPAVWQQALNSLKASDFSSMPAVDAYQRAVFFGCGSTYYLSIWAARLARRLTQVEAYPAPSSELLVNPEVWLDGAEPILVVAISRSGETTETLRSLEAARDRGIRSVAITCYPKSSIASLTDSLIAVPNAQEQSVAQTRSFTTMMLGAAALMGELGSDNPSGRLGEAGAQLIAACRPLAVELGANRELSRFYFLADGQNYGLACEAMLKMKEISLSPSEAYHSHEIRHGPMSMVDESALIVGFVSPRSREPTLRVLEDMADLGAKTIVVGPDDAGDFTSHEAWIEIPKDLPTALQSLFYMPLAQLLALERGRAKGLNADNPRNLQFVVKDI